MSDLIDEARVIAGVRHDIPLWTLVFGVLGPVLVAACWGLFSTLSVGGLISRKFRELDDGVHWTERARHWEPVVVAMRNIAIFTSVFGAALGWLTGGPFSLLPMELLVLFGAMGGYAGSIAGQMLFLPRIARVTSRELFRRYVIYRICFGMGIPLWIVSLLCVSETMSVERWLVMLVSSLMFLAASLWPPLGIARALGVLREADEPYQKLLSGISDRLGHEPRGLWVFDMGLANAFALYVSNNIVMTEQLLECVNDDELDTILVHEMAHLTDRASNKFGGAAGILVLALIPFAAATFLSGHWSGWVLLFVVVGLLILNRRSARRMEDHADETSTRHQFDEGVYARALEKIYAYNLFAAVRSKRKAHAHLYDRMLAAGVTPDYPRPEPPPRHRLINGGFSVITWLAICFAVFFGILAESGWYVSDHPHIATGILGGSEELEERLSYNRAEEGERDAALLHAEGMVLASGGSLLSILHLASRQCEAGLAEQAMASHARAMELAREPKNKGLLDDPEQIEFAHLQYLESRLPDCKVQ